MSSSKEGWKSFNTFPQTGDSQEYLKGSCRLYGIQFFQRSQNSNICTGTKLSEYFCNFWHIQCPMILTSQDLFWQWVKHRALAAPCRYHNHYGLTMQSKGMKPDANSLLQTNWHPRPFEVLVSKEEELPFARKTMAGNTFRPFSVQPLYFP